MRRPQLAPNVDGVRPGFIKENDKVTIQQAISQKTVRSAFGSSREDTRTLIIPIPPGRGTPFSAGRYNGQFGCSALVITESDCAWIEQAFDAVIAESHRVPGAVWSLSKTLADRARKNYAAK